MSAPKTVAQLAQSGYEAYCKMAREVDNEGLAAHALTWDELDSGTQQCWVATATQLWAEMSAIQIGVAL